MSAEIPTGANAVNLANIVNLIGSNVRADEEQSSVGSSSAKSIRLASSGTPRRSAYSYIPKSPQLEEIVFAEPTFSERFARYLVIVLYLCGLCSLGFILSLYHFFAWDSRMPPVFKGQKKAPAFG